MNKFDLLDDLAKKKNGLIRTSDAITAGVSKTHFLEFIREYNFEKLAHGVYLSSDGWEDPYFVFQATHMQTVFSHETALYLLALSDREPPRITVTVKRGYNTSKLKKVNIKAYTIPKELYPVGIIEIVTPIGHRVRTYNMERTLCDILRTNKTEIQWRQTALKEYVLKSDKNIPRLMEYGRQFKVDKILRRYLEVLL